MITGVLEKPGCVLQNCPAMRFISHDWHTKSFLKKRETSSTSLNIIMNMCIADSNLAAIFIHTGFRGDFSISTLLKAAI